MDCKHEKLELRISWLGEDVKYLCQEPSCVMRFESNQVVILTKTQYALTQAVVELARKKRKLYKEWEAMEYKGEINNEFLIFTDKKYAIWKKFNEAIDELDKALDALDKGE